MNNPDEPSELSESGSPIIHHKAREKPFTPVCGKEELIKALSAHITKHLGEPSSVFHELVSDLVHIDVHLVPPRPDRNFYTLLTTGMSELSMKVPEGAEEWAFAELMICLPPDWKLTEADFKDENNYWPIRLLKTLARFPHEYDTWLSLLHTIPNGDPPEPFAPNVKFCCAILAPPTLVPDGFETAQVHPEVAVNFLAIIPLYAEEVDFKLKQGGEKLFERFDAEQINELVNVGRKNVAKKKRFGLF